MSKKKPSVYGLLNYYRDYVPAFAEVTEPLRAILGDDYKGWTQEAAHAVQTAVSLILEKVPWLAFDPEHEARVQTRVTPMGVSVLLL